MVKQPAGHTGTGAAVANAPGAPRIESSLDQLLASAEVGTWEFDVRADRLRWSPTYYRLLGRDPAQSEPGFAEWLQTLHPDDREAIREKWQIAAAGGDGTFEHTGRVLTDNGTWRWFASRGRIMRRDATGAPLLAAGTVADVTLAKYDELLVQAQRDLLLTINRSLDRDGMLSALFDVLAGLPEVDGGGIYWRNADGSYSLVAHRGLSNGFVSRVASLTADSPRVNLINSGKILCACVDDTPLENARSILEGEEIRGENITALGVIPIQAGGVTIACLNLASRSVRTWTPSLFEGFCSLAGQFGESLKHYLASEELRQQRANLDGLFASMDEMVFVIDDAGTVLHWNPAVERLGYGESLRGTSVIALHPPELRDATIAIFQDVLAGKRSDCPMPLMRADGSRFDSDTRVVKGVWNGRQVMFGITRDITAQARQQEALRLSRQYADDIITSLPGVFYVVDLQGRLKRWNQRFTEVTGYSDAQMEGMEVSRLFAGEDLPALDAAIRRVFSEGDATLEAPLLTQDGRRIPHFFTGRRTTIGGLEYLVGVGLDRSSEAATLSALADERAQLRTLIETIPNLVWLKDADGVYLDCNLAFARFMGRDRTELLGKTDYDLVPAEQADIFRDNDRLALAGGTPHINEEAVTYQDTGRRAILQTVKTPMYSARGELVGVLGISNDVTTARNDAISLRERVKEMRCLYDVFRATEGMDSPLPQMLQRVADRLPEAMLHPGIAAARVRSGDLVVATANFRETPWMLMTRLALDERGGDLTVAYLEAPPEIDGSPFLPEERQMLDTIASRVGGAMARRRYAQTLAQRDAVYSAIVTQAPDWLGLVDAHDGRIVEFNEAAHARLGYTREEFAQMSVADLGVTETREQILAAIAQRRAAGGGRFETQHRRKDGSAMDVLVNARLLTLGDRQYFATVVSDLGDMRRIESALRGSEAALRRAQAVSQTGSWEADADGNLTWSDETYRMFKVPVGTPMTVHKFITFVHPDDQERVTAAWRDSQAGTHDYDIEHRIVVGGNELWVRERAEFPRAADGRTALAYGTVQDITQRRLASEAVRKLSLAIEQSPTAIIITDRDARIEYVNRSFEKLTGYAESEVQGTNPRLLKSTRTPAGTYAALWSTLASGAVWHGEFINCRKDGTHFAVYARISPLRDENGQVTHYIAAEEDITSRREQEAELERYRLHLEEMVQSRTDQLAEANARLHITQRRLNAVLEISRRAETMEEDDIVRLGLEKAMHIHGASRGAVYFSGTAAACSHDSPPRVVTSVGADKPWGPAMWRNHVQDGGIWFAEGHAGMAAPVRDATGVCFVMELAGAPGAFDDGDGGELKLLAADLWAVVLHRRAEAALAVARDAAETANRAKSSFIANMSHEIRTPMNAIIGLAHLLERSPLNPRQQEQVEKVGGAARHLLGILNDILDHSKIEAGRMTLEQRDYELARVVGDACALVSERAESKGLLFHREIDPALPATLHGDPLRIGQVLINLCGNAVKFTDQGSVSLLVRRITGGDGAPRVRFEVRDTGVGMTEEHMQRLFQPFEQADASTTRRFGGTGLGLTISRQFVRLMDGHIGVDSRDGEGSCFWFEVPLVGATGTGTVETPAAPVAGKHAERGVRILLVEDDEINQEVAAELLRGAGHEVDIAADGAQAVAKAGSGDYELILMDVQMPVMDGLAATRALRRTGAHANTPILAMTASAFTEDRQRCIEAGMNGFVPKPVVPSVLFESVRQWAGRHFPPETPGTAPGPRLPAGLAAIAGLDSAAGLRACQLNADTYLLALQAFRASGADVADALYAALANRDVPELVRITESLAQSADTIGARVLHEAADGLRRNALAAMSTDALTPHTLALTALLRELLSDLAGVLDGATGH